MSVEEPFKWLNRASWGLITKNRKVAVSDKILYAHMLIVVTFLVVNFFGFLVIARDHGSFEGRH